MSFKYQNDVHFDLNRALESDNLYRAIQDWRQRMALAIRRDLKNEEGQQHHRNLMESIYSEIAYEDLIESLLITIGSLQRRLGEGKVTLEGRTERVTLEEGGLT